MTANTGQHKVYLQKREGEEVKGEIGGGITCSICGDSLPGARELGVHILAAHCDVYQQEEGGDNLVIDGSPGLSMEVEVDPLEPTSRPEQGEGSAAITLPRPPTANELKQKFMAYRVSDTNHRYICLVCEKMYTSRYNIRMHMNLHTGNNVHTCQFCGRKFAHKHVFESHVRTHTGERPFACEKCDRRFGDRSNCSSHMKRCIGVNTEEDLSPDSDTMSDSFNIAPNVSLTPIKKLKKEVDDMICEDMLDRQSVSSTEDPLTLSFKPQIVSVQSISVGNNNEVEFENMGYVDDEEEEEESEEDSEEMMIEPDISLDYEDIEAEEGEESLNMFYTCSFCSTKYSQQSLLLEHLSAHVDIPHKPVPTELDQGYMTLYTTSRPKFMCLYCGKFFVTAATVAVHVKVHAAEKIYTCELCEKVFLHKHIYESHRRTEHPGARRPELQCSFCSEPFISTLALINHTRSCHAKPIQITQMLDANHNNNPEKKKPKANRPPPKLILLNSSDHQRDIVEGSDHIIIQKAEKKTPVELTRKHITIAPKPTVSLLSEEAKKIFQNSTPPVRRLSGNSNPRAHKIVETPAGREYIPDTNSNNIVNLNTVYPPPSGAETKRGFMLRPCGKYKLGFMTG